eukprot:7864585-Pyramimonas_sp.AAC.1
MVLAWTRTPWSLPSTAFSVSRRRSRGVFSRRFAPWKAACELKAPLSFATWNTRALQHRDVPIRQHKMKHLSQFLCRGTIMALQGVHATEVERQQDLFKLSIPHLSFSSFGAQRITGGVAIITPCSQKGVHKRARFWHEELVPGRIQRLRISGVSTDSHPV